jgi:hypothetical protein
MDQATTETAKRTGWRTTRFIHTLAALAVMAMSCGQAGDGEIEPQLGKQREALTTWTDQARLAPGSLTETSNAGTATTDHVGVVKLTKTRFVTVHRMADGKPRLVVWRLNEAGEIDQRGNFTDDVSLSEFSVARVSTEQVVIAARTAEGNLRVAHYRVRDDTISLLAVATGGGITTVDVATVTREPQPMSDTSSEDEENGPGDFPELIDFPPVPFVSHVVVAVGVESMGGKLKLLVHRVLSPGAIERVGEATSDIDVSKVRIAAPAQPWGTVVTAAKDLPSGNLRMTAWTVDAQGAIVRGVQTASVGAVGDVDITPLSYRRVGVVTTKTTELGASQVVSLWDIVGSGATLRTDFVDSGASAGSAPVAIVNGGGSRLYTLSRNKVSSWEAIGQVKALDNRSITGMTSSSSVAIAQMIPDRPIAVFSDSANTLKLKILRDWDVPLLRGEWPASFGADLCPTPGTPTCPIPPRDDPGMAPLQVAEFGSDVRDVSLAVGRKAVIASNMGELVFFDRAGNRLGQKHENVPTNVSIRKIFASVLSFNLPNGEPNEQSLLRHLTAQEYCDPELPDSNCRSANYDPRIAYNDDLRRFFIMTAFKGHGERYHGFAVSKTDDPRDGFHVYLATEEKCQDMPIFGISNGMLLFGKGGNPNSPLAPALVVYDANVMANPVRTGETLPRRIPVSKLAFAAVGDKWVKPTVEYGANPPYSIVYRASDDADAIRFYALPKPFGAPLVAGGPPTVAPVAPVAESFVQRTEGLGWFSKYPDVALRVSQPMPGVWDGSFTLPLRKEIAGSEDDDIHLARLTLRIAPSSSTLLTAQDAGVYRLRCPGRTATARSSCLLATSTETANHILLSYLRYSPNGAFFPSAGYAQVDPDTMQLYFGRIGDVKPGIAKPDYSHSGLDYTASVPDPVDGSAWMIQLFGGTTSKSGHKVVLARSIF